jgi:hypothetical protein
VHILFKGDELLLPDTILQRMKRRRKLHGYLMQARAVAHIANLLVKATEEAFDR